MKDLTILQGDSRDLLKAMPDDSVDCIVTSPPYWGLRDYGVAGQIGQEETPEAFIAVLVDLFREARRVLKPAGTCWVNMGDSYNAYNANRGKSTGFSDGKAGRGHPTAKKGLATDGLKNKDLVGQPWMLAFALRADGWFLRQDIIWHKPNPMPESVTDRCTKAHEYVFLLTKSERYFYDADAVKEKASPNTNPRLAGNGKGSWNGSKFHEGKTAIHQLRRSQKDRKHDPAAGNKNSSFDEAMAVMPEDRNKRSVWTVPSAPFKEAHFATYPPDLIKPCILAGCPVGGVVLDPFGGSGTTGAVALELGRRAILMELNPEYVSIIHRRTTVTPGLGL